MGGTRGEEPENRTDFDRCKGRPLAVWGGEGKGEGPGATALGTATATINLQCHQESRLGLWALRITFRVAEPAAWARHLRLCSSANAVTGQGLGGKSAATGAGNPVLGAVPSLFINRRRHSFNSRETLC